ncbi:MAG: alkaline phytoceramidase [Planctomycetes bacterium]|nr:alkaline phytoceramidase [Planctomycetota bacterium]
MNVPFPVRVAFLILGCMLFIGGFLLLKAPIPQPEAYHNFADQRPLLGMPHMLNVWSNLPFLIVGVWGMIWMWQNPTDDNRPLTGLGSPRPFLQTSERWAYWLYFIGLALTGIGSSWYHANPNNETLVWDRMALAWTFMALFTAIVAERLSWQISAPLVGPMVALGVGSVLYWHWTETQNAGDLRFYLVVQFFPLITLPMLFLFFNPRYSGTGDMLASLLCYGLAKVVEYLDRDIYSQAAFVSGHTLKHVIAGLSAYLVLFMLQRRHAIEPSTEERIHEGHEEQEGDRQVVAIEQ